MKAAARLTRLTPPGEHYFFGYYDLVPDDTRGEKFLALKTGFLDRLPSPGDEAEIFLLETGKSPARLGATAAWNWQLGARMQWLPGGHEVIYNILEGNRQAAEILDLRTGRRRLLPLPVFALLPGGDRALALDFSRWSRFRPSYGYPGDFPGTGGAIHLLDIARGEYRPLVELEEVRTFSPPASLEPGRDWTDHALINPGGTRFCFLHRWTLPGGGIYTRVFTAGTEGGGLRLLLDSGLATHFSWRDDDTLIGWGRLPGGTGNWKRSRIAMRALRPLFPIYRRFAPRRAGGGYFLLGDRSGSREPLGTGVFPGDGHPGYSPDRRWLLTDTYPDSSHRRRLLLFDTEAGELSELASLRSLPAEPGPAGASWDGSGMRCDLHPRWNRNGKSVYFDSVHEGFRGIYRADLEFFRK